MPSLHGQRAQTGGLDWNEERGDETAQTDWEHVGGEEEQEAKKEAVVILLHNG